MANIVQSSINKIRSFAKKIYDNEGMIQQGQFAPIKQANQAFNSYVAKPLVQGMASSYKPLTDWVNPKGFQAERQSIAQGGNLGNQKFMSAMKAVPKATFDTYGLMKGGITAPLISGAFGGAINKATGGSFGEGFKKGVEVSPTISGIGAVTNPLIAKGALKASSSFVNPASQFIAGRLATGLGNIPEGIVMNNALGRDALDPASIGIDFASGVAFGSGAPNRVKVKGVGELYQSDINTVKNTLKKAANNFLNSEGKIDVKALEQATKDAEIYRKAFGITKTAEELATWNKLPIPEQFGIIAKKMQDLRASGEGIQMGLVGKKQPFSIGNEPSAKVKLTPEGKLKVKYPKKEVRIPEIDGVGDVTPLKPKEIPTPNQLKTLIPSKIDEYLQDTAGYSTKPLKGGTKGANFYQRFMRKTDNAISTYLEKGLTSQNPLFRKTSATLHGFFKELGTSEERQIQNFELKGGIAVAKQRAYDVAKSLYDLVGHNKDSLRKIDAVIDPTSSKLKVKFNDLSDSEKQAYLLIRKGLDLVHDISYANGNLSKEKYIQNKGKYAPIMYRDYELPTEVNNFIKSNPNKIDTTAYRSRKEFNDYKRENKLDDPIYALAKRLTQVETNRTVKKYTDYIASKPNFTSDLPLNGYTKLSDSPAYGALAGKYVVNSAVEELQGHFFANQTLNTFYDAFKKYDRLPIRQLQKKLLTVFNPTTNVGNITTDNVFGFLAGVDPFNLNKNIVWLMKNKKSYKQVSDYMMRNGITGTDITRTDFTNNIGTVDDIMKPKGMFAKIIQKPQDFYGGTDDLYKAAAFKGLLDQGKTLEEATKLVKDGFQNYQNVGKFYDFASKTPFIGAPFIKFQGDLMRITKNAMVNKPLHLLSFLVTLKGIEELASRASGETPEQKQAREGRFGAKKIPGLDISLNWQTPWGEIDVARYLSPYSATNLNESEGNQTIAKVLPFYPEVGRDASGNIDVATTVSLNANDPLLSPLIQGVVDRDFRGKQISDPNMTDAEKLLGSDLPKGEQKKNTAKFIGRGYLPPPVNSALDVGSALKGEKNMYGQTQTPTQAALRMAGIKVSQQTPEIIKEGESKSAYFDAKNPAFQKLQAAEKAAALSIPKQDPEDVQSKMSKYQTLLQYPAVYNYQKEIAINKVNGDMSKVDPLYTYPENEIRKFMRYQSLGGSDLGSAEAKALYKAEPIIKEISQSRAEYYKKNPIQGSDYTSSRPVASERAQALMNQGQWNDPEVKAYLEANTAWKNMNREKMGLPPLPESGGFKSYQKKPKKVKIGKAKKVRLKKSSFKTKKIKTPKLKKISYKTLSKLKTPKTSKIKVKMPKFNA